MNAGREARSGAGACGRFSAVEFGRHGGRVFTVKLTLNDGSCDKPDRLLPILEGAGVTRR
jgi:hypothetical protein